MRSPDTMNKEPNFLLQVTEVPWELLKEESYDLLLVLGTRGGRVPFAEVPRVPEELPLILLKKALIIIIYKFILLIFNIINRSPLPDFAGPLLDFAGTLPDVIGCRRNPAGLH